MFDIFSWQHIVILLVVGFAGYLAATNLGGTNRSSTSTSGTSTGITGVSATAVTFNPTGTLAYTANRGSNNVSIIDVGTRQVIGNIQRAMI